MKQDRETAPLVLRRTERGLEPRSRFARDLLEQYALHSDVEITIKKRRSAPQLRRYWVMLHQVVEATGAWPTAEHAHESIKLALGMVTPIKLLNGGIAYIPDSAAMSKMDAVQFSRFFEAAAALIAERFGFDPLDDASQSEAA